MSYMYLADRLCNTFSICTTFCLLTGLNMFELAAWAWYTLSWPAWTWYVELANLNMVRRAGQLEHGTLSWPAWTWYVELASLNSVVDRLVHACWNRLFMTCWTNRLEQRCWNHHDKSTARCSSMIEDVVREWWNNKIVIACSNLREQPLSIRQAVYNMLMKHD